MKKKYTVKQVSELSGASIRTLHYYDEIGLLEPAFYGDNGYRFYEQDQLLILQQIFFYKELGFELSQIQKILMDPNFDQKAALQNHKKLLSAKLTKTKELINTIDKTIAHLKKENAMKDKDLYKGFDPAKQQQYENEIVQRWGKKGADGIAESKRKTKNWKMADFNSVQNDYDLIHKQLVEEIQKKMQPNSASVQEIIESHYQIVKKFWTPDKVAYKNLGEYYCEHSDFKKLYDGYHPQLADFLRRAMAEYANRNLT